MAGRVQDAAGGASATSDSDDDELVADVVAASQGDRDAWVRIHDRYASLIWSIARGYRLETTDASDVCQTTWLRLAENIGRIRQPAQLRSWLVTTARREALRVQHGAKRTTPIDLSLDPYADPRSSRADDDLVRREESGAVVRAFLALPGPCQVLLRVLMADPQPSYSDVSVALGMPVGSIGPRRARCLDRLRVIGNLDLDDGRPAA